MHTSTLLSVLVAIGFAFASPQSSLNDLPTCAQQAGLAAIDATGCSLGDISCICNSVPFINTLRTYIVNNCSPSDQAAALEFGQSTCAPYGVTFSASVAGVTATTITSAVQSDVAPMNTVAPAGTATSTIKPTDSAMAFTATGTWTSSWASSVPTGNSTATLLPYTGAASSFGYKIAMLLAGAAGLAVFLV